MIVDEAHCLSHWGANFQKKYGTLGMVRNFLPGGTPVIALTATLTGRVRCDIQSKLQFPKFGSLFRNEGNDRPNVSIVVRACHNPLNSFTDLDFVIPNHIKNHQDIPKTWIYVDNINTGNEMINYLSGLLERQQQAQQDISSMLMD